MKTFLSFSSKDSSFVAKLKARLKAQPINLWDYSLETQEIPGGAPVASYLSERVAASDVFIPLVTPNSVGSAYTQVEVRTALECAARGGSLRVLPLVLRSMVPSEVDWGEVYRPLRDLRWFEVDFERRDQWEEAVRRICETLGLAAGYRGLMPERPVLPFMKRFDDELRDVQRRDPERFDGIYARLERIKNSLVVAMDGGEHEHAHDLAEFFLSTCKYEFPLHDFYYPAVTKVICLLGLGRYSEAYEQGRELLDHPRLDETLFGLLGYIRQSQGSYAEAAGYYRAAFELDRTDIFAASGLVINTTLAGCSDGLEQALRVLETDTTRSAQDRLESEIVRAYALATRGDRPGAIALFRSAIRRGSENPSAFIGCARALADEEEFQDASDVLKQGLERCAFPEELYTWKAFFHTSCGEMEKALRCVEAAINDARVCAGSELLAHRLQLLASTRRDREARLRAEELLNVIDRPSTPDDFYHAGFANWILRRRERAMYDFERSGRNSAEFYE